MMSATQQISLFLVDTLMTLYILFLMARAILEASQADFYNPVSQSVYKITQPLLRLVRLVIPAVGVWDIGCWLLIYVMRVAELFLIMLIQGGSWPIELLLRISAFQVVEWLIQFYAISIFILAIASWFVSPVQMIKNPVLSLLNHIVTPLIAPVRRFMPTVGVVDFSPLIVLLGLYLLLNIIRTFY